MSGTFGANSTRGYLYESFYINVSLDDAFIVTVTNITHISFIVTKVFYGFNNHINVI